MIHQILAAVEPRPCYRRLVVSATQWRYVYDVLYIEALRLGYVYGPTHAPSLEPWISPLHSRY